MSEWCIKPLGELVQIMGDGGTPARDDPSNFGGNVPWIVIDDIVRNIEITKENLTNKGVANSSAKLWPKMSIILSTGATIGKVGIAQVPVTTKQGITGIIPNSLISSHYLYYALLLNKPKIQAWAQGSTFFEIRVPILSKVPIKLPKEKSEQNKITTILSTIDETIEHTEALIEKYQHIKAGMMNDLFTRGVLPDGTLRPTRDEAPELYYETPIGWIPKEWDVNVTGKICSSIVPSRNKPHLDGGELPWITVADLLSDYVYESEIGLSVSRNSLRLVQGRTIPRRAVIMSCVGTFGEVSIVENELVMNQQLHGFVTDYKIIPEWLAYNLKRQKRFMERIATQTTILYMNKSACESIPVVLPSIKEQEIIMKKIKSISSRIFSESNLLFKLKKQKSGLMNDLLTGEVRVKPGQE